MFPVQAPEWDPPERRIGLFICDCGGNVSEALDTCELSQFASSLSGVSFVQIQRLWCSADGCAEMASAIVEHDLTHVVVAACSPKQHERTFHAVMTAAGRNPFLLQMANIREQVAWCTQDRHEATEKAKLQVAAAVKRVQHQEPIAPALMDANTDFLVIGAGAAGMSAALTLAQKGRKVTVIEREPWIGGKIVAYEEVFPDLECAPCMLEPLMDHLLHDERISVMTASEVTNIRGFFGNYEVTIHKKARYIDPEACMGCGACYDSCPVMTTNREDGGLSQRHAIYTPFPGALPNMPFVDSAHCLRHAGPKNPEGEECTACAQSCPFGAVDFSQEDAEVTLKVGAIVVATGFDLFDPSAIQTLAPGAPNVLTSYQFERMLCREGATAGRVQMSSGEAPKSLAFIHCVGSCDSRFKSYCSGVCCANTLKLAHLARKRLEGARIFEFFSEMCLGGKGYREFYSRIQREGTQYIRIENPNDIAIQDTGSGLVIAYEGKSLSVDMAILSTAMVPASGTKALADLMRVPLDSHGFLASEHDRISPVSTTARGIYVAGCASGPKDVPQSVLQGQAAAGLALSALVPGEMIEITPAVSVVDGALCGACRTCVPLCPYQAIAYDPECGTAAINSALCRGCGVCVSACPAAAIKNLHFTNDQINAEIEAVLA